MSAPPCSDRPPRHLAQGNEPDAERQCARDRSSCAFHHFPNLRHADLLPAQMDVLGKSIGVGDEGAPGPPTTRYGDLVDERSANILGDTAVLATAWTPLPRTVANAVASLVSFSVASLEPLLYEVFTQRPLPTHRHRGRASSAASAAGDESGGDGGGAAGAAGGAAEHSTVQWVGCHADRSDAPQLPHFRGSGVGTEQCASLCNGYPFFAMQAPGGQCRCGVLALTPHAHPSHAASGSVSAEAYRKVDNKECGKPCPGEAGLQPERLCGGRQRNAIYRLFAPLLPPSNVSRAAAASRAERDGVAVLGNSVAASRLEPPASSGGAPVAAPGVARVGAALEVLPATVASVAYIGCAEPPRGGSVLPYARGSGHTTTSCAAVCRQFGFFALSHAKEWGECACGDRVTVDGGSIMHEVSVAEPSCTASLLNRSLHS